MNSKALMAVALCVSLVPFAGPWAHADDSAAATEWAGYIQPLQPLGGALAAELRDPADRALRIELYRLIHSTFAYGYFGAVHQDVVHPDFWPFFDNQVFSLMFPNPDDAYHMVRIDPKGIYRIVGYRGTTRMVDMQLAGRGTMFTQGNGGKWDYTLANFDLDRDVHLKPDGSYEVILSAERPAGWTGDWWKLEPETSKLTVRQISYDWVREEDGRLAIVRLDTPPRRLPDTPDETDAKLKNIAAWAQGWSKASIAYAGMLREDGPENTLRVMARRDVGNMTDQRYIDGIYRIAPDEALILETDVPDCRYWSFMLTNELIVTEDAMYRQSNLNGHTGHVDADGKFRGVIAGSDPGVANWLDTGGKETGVIYGRWKRCDRFPTPVLRKVKLADVRSLLPAGTAMVTPAQRDEAIRARAIGMQFRRRW